ncbi:hypothetical protein [Microbacterium sp. JZ31]|uniref:hypothetical protein n=1 Tax=Microbacterium sp. JZ31 TaxID=1906274 RepID=UPI001EE43F81|nr:hypothetical protein [Microbacterium sp. JZ31]
MTEMHTMVRTEIRINGESFLLAQGQDLAALKKQIVDAAHSLGDFVEFVVVGNRSVSALITHASQVVMSVATVLVDPRDTGDPDAPFGGLFDRPAAP